MNEKHLHRFDFKWQAQALINELSAQGIEAKIISRPREYAAVVTGGVEDQVDVYIDAKDYIRAHEALLKVQGHQESSHEPAQDNRNYFKRTIIFSFLGVIMLPLIFNWAATLNFLKLKEQKVSSVKKSLALIILLSAWILALVEVYFIVRNFSGLT